MKKSFRAFTLVELIVVIVILAILGTIGFVSLQGYQVSARDSVRVSDMKLIAKSLSLYHTKEDVYPNPSNAFPITFSGSDIWYQGSFGNSVALELGSFSEAPTDPLFRSLYTYSLTSTRQEYELAGVSERGEVFSLNSSQAFASDTLFSAVYGNYNRQFISLQQGSQLYLIGAPTLITTFTGAISIDEILSSQAFAVQGGQNLPGTSILNIEGRTFSQSDSSFIPGTLSGTTAPVLYVGTNEGLSTYSDKSLLGNNLASYYGNSNLGESSYYNQFSGMSEDQLVDYVNSLIQSGYGGLDAASIQLSEVTIPETPISTGIPCVFGETNIGECDFQ